MSGLRSGGLFAGYGGLDMAVAEVFGAEPAWFSEIEDAPSKILAHHWPTVPNHGDITQIDWAQVEPVDILSGGFPCQDVSLAGKRAGLTAGTRSGLWSYFAAGIAALRPRYVAIENVRGLLSAEAHSDVEPCPWCLGDGSGQPPLRALGAVFGDLADLGYDARGCGIRAADVGAPHGRFRFFILAWDTQVRGWDGARPALGGGEPTRPAGGSGLAPANADRDGLEGRQRDAGPAGRGRRLADPSQPPASDASGNGRQRRTEPDQWPSTGLAAPLGDDTDRRRDAATHAASNGRHEGRPESAGELGGPDAAECCPTCGDPVEQHDADGFCAGRCGGSCTDPEWGRPDVAAYAAGERHGDAWTTGVGGISTAIVRGSTDHQGGLNAYATEDRSRQDVRDLREDLHPAPVRESTRGQVPLPLATPLLAGMREHEASGEQGRESLASPQVQGSSVRGVLGDHATSRSSQGPESGEQRPGEPSDAVRLLSPEAALAGGPGEPTCGCAAWGQYAPAIHRWERILGRLAPEPTQVGPKGARRLSPLAVEFMMGLPAGHVTAVPGVNRNAQLKALGNGVVPQQAIAALRHMHTTNQLLATA